MYFFHKNRGDNKTNGKDYDTVKRMPVWRMISTDILLTAAFLGIYSYYHLVVPRTLSDEKAIIIATAQDNVNTFVLPDGTSNSDTDTSANAKTKTNTNTGTDTNIDTDTSSGKDTDTNDNLSNDKVKPTDSKKINYGNNGTMDIASDISNSKVSSLEDAVTEVNSFRDDNLQFSTNKAELGSGSDKITYYVSDIYVTNVNYGGKSAAMVFDGSYVNQPSQGGRTVSDIVYIGE